MNVFFKFFFLWVIFTGLALTGAQARGTQRISQFENDRVNVWQTIIYPSTKQALTMHRHEHDRVLVALNHGLLKITNDTGEVHYLKLIKNQSYYLTKDKPQELHTDENISHHPIKVVVIELKNK